MLKSKDLCENAHFTTEVYPFRKDKTECKNQEKNEENVLRV